MRTTCRGGASVGTLYNAPPANAAEIGAPQPAVGGYVTIVTIYR